MTPLEQTIRPIVIGALMKKEGGDYKFTGIVRAVFTKKNGAQRVVLENSDGILHIFNPSQLTKAE